MYRYISWSLSQSLFAISLFMCAGLIASKPVFAQRTIDTYAIANGFGAGAIRIDQNKLISFKNHIYQSLDAGQNTPELCFDAYFGILETQNQRWLSESSIQSVDVLPDTNILQITQRQGDLEIVTSYFAPYTFNRSALVMMVTVKNQGQQDKNNFSLVSLHNFRIGQGNEGNQQEQAAYQSQFDAIVEQGARGGLIISSLQNSSNHTMTPSDPYPLVRAQQALPTVNSSGIRDNVVHGMTWSPPQSKLAAGASFTTGILITFTESQNQADITTLLNTINTWKNNRTATQILQDERIAAEQAVAQAHLPNSLHNDERKLAGYALALLRVAQVRELGEGAPRRNPHGQIVASLPSGIWNITWVRDAAYAIEGLLDVDMHTQANDALQFMIDATANEYTDYVGREYLLSVTRYYGGGREESDWNAGGPNVEWDNFGLFLHAYAKAIDANLPVATSISNLARVKSGVADVIVHLIDQRTGLLVPDSSIWETHWEPTFESKGRQTYTYSSAMAAAGLFAFAQELQERQDPDAARYLAAATQLQSGIKNHLFDAAGVLASCREDLQQGHHYLDAAVVEAFNKNALDPQNERAKLVATLGALQALQAPLTAGFIRNDEGGEYDSQEWLVVDLWMAKALRSVGAQNATQQADDLLHHVTTVGLDNLGHIPELLSQEQGAASGAIPMMGFGAGAYLSALVDRTRAQQPVAADAGVADDAGVPNVSSDAGEPVSVTDAGEPTSDAGTATDAGHIDDGLDAGHDDPEIPVLPTPTVTAPTPEPETGCQATTTTHQSLLLLCGVLSAISYSRTRRHRGRISQTSMRQFF